MAATERIPFAGLRGGVARATSAAWQAPRVAAGVDVDMRRTLGLVARLRAEAPDGVRPTVTHVVARAIALTLGDHPRLNAHVDDAGVVLHDAVHLGLAVDVGDGVMVPVIRDAAQKSVLEIAREAGELAQRARRNELGTSAMLGGTVTLSTLGATGIAWFTPILNAPQAAIVGIGAVAERPAIVDGELGRAPMMTATVVFDHRAVDGAPAGRFLYALAERLQEPSTL